MKKWNFENLNYKILVIYYEGTNEYSVTLVTLAGWTAELKFYKNKGGVNRYLKKYGIEERI